MSHPCFGLVSVFWGKSRIGWMLLLALAGVTNPALCQSSQLTPSEQLIVRRLAEGAPAELSEKEFGTETVGNAFLNKLLSGGLKTMDAAGNMSLYGIVISHAVFNDQVNIHFEVPYRVEFKHCRFSGGIDFTGGVFDKDLDFESDVFGRSAEDDAMETASHDEVNVEFTGAVISGTLTFRKGFFYTPVDFTKIHTRDLIVDHVAFEWRGDAPDLDFTEARVDSDMSLSVERRHPGQVVAEFLNVGGTTTLGTQESNKAASAFFGTRAFDLTYSRFQNLTIYSWQRWTTDPVVDSAISLDGFAFQEIAFPPTNADAQANERDCNHDQLGPSTLLCLLDSPKAAYSTEPYMQLEQNLTASGRSGRANDAYIHMRNRQRRHRLWQPLNIFAAFIAWLVDWFLFLVVGYGRLPWLAGLWAAMFVAVGMVVFRRERMQEQNDCDENSDDKAGMARKPEFSPFWYSLDVLAPAIELGVDKAWEPKPDAEFRWVHTFAYFQRIAGWILAPLVLAAIGGIIH